MRDDAITFNVRPSHTDEVSVDYLPFGTRVLKIRVVNVAGPTDVPLVLRPANTFVPPDRPGLLASQADDHPGVWITWGGGHELGPCVHGRDIGWQELCAPLPRGAASYTHVHVTHHPDVPATHLQDATLTLFAMAGQSDVPAGCLRINLRVPGGCQSADPVRPVWVPCPDGGQIEFQGAQLPTYLSRWWPRRSIRYAEAPALDLSIHYQPVAEPAAWPWLRLWRLVGATLLGDPARVEIRLRDRPVMEIAGPIEPAFFRDRWMLPELYRFYHPRYLVVRLWFFWLDTHLDVVRHTVHEIPDIERFDVLIDLEEDRALYACTDLHWREMWGLVQQQPIKSHIGLSAGRLLKLLGQRLTEEFFDLLAIWEATGEVVRDPAVHLCGELTGHADCDHRLVAPGEETVVRGAGLYAKHSPYFDDETVRLDGRLASGDVRLG